MKTKNLFLALAILILNAAFYNCAAQNIGINATGATPNASAALDIDMNQKGLLIPRMSTINRDLIASPVNSLLIFNTDNNCFQAFIGTAWQNIFCGCSAPPTGVTASANPNPVCAGSTLTLTGGATGATSWSWTGPNGYTSTSQNPTIANITTAGDSVYTLTASNSCGSATPASTASVTVNSFIGTGGTITYSDASGLNPRSSPPYPGGYTIHTFTSSGTFDVVCGSMNVEVLVVAGGGGGSGGGGGGGGVIYNASYAASGSITVTIGAGGGADINGANSIFGSLNAIGGGAGGNSNQCGVNGGSGGGGGWGAGGACGGAGTAGQGNAGGGGNNSNTPPHPSGGGGGAGAIGGTSSDCCTGGSGGNGLAYAISGSSVFYAGGGGGAVYYSGTSGIGGAGGGGNGANNGSGGTAGSANTGGGGGGNRGGNAYSGGSGIVIVRYIP